MNENNLKLFINKIDNNTYINNGLDEYIEKNEKHIDILFDNCISKLTHFTFNNPTETEFKIMISKELWYSDGHEYNSLLAINLKNKFLNNGYNCDIEKIIEKDEYVECFFDGDEKTIIVEKLITFLKITW